MNVNSFLILGVFRFRFLSLTSARTAALALRVPEANAAGIPRAALGLI